MRLAFGIFAASIVAVAACGARTGLPVDPGAGGRGAGGGEGGTGGLVGSSVVGGTGGAPVDAGLDARGVGGGDAAVDAASDASSDAPVVMDAASDAPELTDASMDAPEIVDAPSDAVELMDAPFDASSDAPEDAPIIGADCVDAGVTYIYLIGSDNALLKFDPPSLAATTIGVIDCPVADAGSATPYSMAVDRNGIAYVVYTDGELFRVSTLTASCEATPFVIGQNGYSAEFGMGFSADVNDPSEHLFVAGNISEQLATLDTTSFTIDPIGTFSSPIGEAELTGTGAGDLYAFGLVIANNMTTTINLSHIDKATATVLSDTVLTVASQNKQIFDWAFAYWGGDFYFFTSTDGATTSVSKYTPGGPVAIPTVTTLGNAIVGAGVSTCAPHP